MSWVRVPPEAADFSQKKSLPQVSLNCVVFLCVCLEGVLKFVYHVQYRSRGTYIRASSASDFTREADV